METFTVRDLSFTYPGQTHPALDRLSLSLEQGAFFVLCGPSGCGKSTLLRQLKTDLAPHGARSGEILFEGRPLEQVDRREQSQRIGFVLQDPSQQLVTDKVWHELAFGLESLGWETSAIRRRVAETAGFFGIQTWFYRDTAQLSGGQKQLLNLAAAMVLQPSVLILDEPTSQLDPIAAGDFLSALSRINRELGTSILLTDHRLEEILPLSTCAAVLDAGTLLASGTPREVGAALRQKNHAMFSAMPAPMRIWAAVDGSSPCPITVREGREWLEALARDKALAPLPPEPPRPGEDAPALLEAEGLWFRYGRDLPDAVKDLHLTVRRGELLALLGGNGTGKTTALKLLASLEHPYRGKVRAQGRVALLPQDPRTLFLKKTAGEDLEEVLTALPCDERSARVSEIAALCRLEGLLDRHPYDLSGGEQQRLALAKVLLTQPDILLLDEPTKGLDAAFKRTLAEILHTLLARGAAVVLVSHDVEFCARYAHRCALFFDGGLVTQAPPRDFFSGNAFYTTAANRMARSLLPRAVTAEDVIAACGAAVPPPPAPPTPPRPGTPKPPAAPLPPSRRRPVSPRTILACALLLLLIPATLLLGLRFLGGQKYYFLSLLVLLETMLPFFLVFEGRRPRAREVVTLAVLCTLGIVGRAAFAMLPQCKPVMAIVILSGAALGGESGFLVGSVTMLLSDILFRQGPWTPWQMFSMGLVGLLAGLLFRPGRLPRRRGVLALYGALAAVVVYGGIMNCASALLLAGTPTPGALLAACLAGLPMDCVQAAATALFLWFAADPFLEKLERVRVKYALVV